jgi:hypothetical protein
MKFIFCSEPFYPNELDYAYKEEAETVLHKGFEYELFSFEDLTEGKISNAFRRIRSCEQEETAIYRGWMLKPKNYEILFNELKARNIVLINAPKEYKHCHYLPESYEIIKQHSPKSIFLPFDEGFNFDDLMKRLSVFGDNPLILKDYVKSRKHEWEEACFIPNASNRVDVDRVVQRFLELQGEDLNEGLVFREFVNFQPLTNHSKSGMPLTKEFRLFFLGKELIFTSEYWEEGIYKQEDFPKDLFLDVAQNVQSNFFTMDIAQKTDGEWLIVELGDAQVAGLPEKANVSDFYDSLGLTPHELWRQDDNGHKFLVETFACEADAVKAMKDFEDRLHKQTYWFEKV